MTKQSVLDALFLSPEEKMGETGGDGKKERVMVRWTRSGVSLDCLISAGEQEVIGKRSLAEAVAGVSGRFEGCSRARGLSLET